MHVNMAVTGKRALKRESEGLMISKTSTHLGSHVFKQTQALQGAGLCSEIFGILTDCHNEHLVLRPLVHLV